MNSKSSDKKLAPARKSEKASGQRSAKAKDLSLKARHLRARGGAKCLTSISGLTRFDRTISTSFSSLIQQ